MQKEPAADTPTVPLSAEQQGEPAWLLIASGVPPQLHSQYFTLEGLCKRYSSTQFRGLINQILHSDNWLFRISPSTIVIFPKRYKR